MARAPIQQPYKGKANIQIVSAINDKGKANSQRVSAINEPIHLNTKPMTKYEDFRNAMNAFRDAQKKYDDANRSLFKKNVEVVAELNGMKLAIFIGSTSRQKK